LSYSAYLRKSATLWEQDILKAEANVQVEASYENKIKLAQAHFGYMNNTMIDQNEKAFNAKIDEVKELLKELQDLNESDGLPDALLSSLHGKEIAFNNMKGMYLGFKSSSLLSDAYRKSTAHPLVLKIYGDYYWYTPEMFGGSKKNALAYYEQSKRAFEVLGQTVENWLYLDLLASLGQAQQVDGQLEMARVTYELALVTEPEFFYVSKGLLPTLIKK
jgi:hypothetical protein